MPRRLRQPLRTLLPLGLCCSLLGQAHALDRVTLRNGFSYDCARQEQVDSTHVRLYPSASDPANFVEVPAAEIVAVEPLPPPPPQPSTSGTAPTQAGPDLHTLLSHAGTTHNIDAELLASIVHAESGGRATAVSRTGALGLMQLMPATAQAMGVSDAFKPDQNINGGTSYFDWLLTRYKDNLALALAAYNAGPGAVDRYHGIPPFRETRAYVARVMTEFKRRKQALEHTLQASR
ncbi:MAG TPA: lytic transglycosylase domain-containing protein [Acidobacteriaceae bacterium]|nr:lytic transglycosylase domain-containing protein [Acidobacteriaceae bacterium]